MAAQIRLLRVELGRSGQTLTREPSGFALVSDMEGGGRRGIKDNFDLFGSRTR